MPVSSAVFLPTVALRALFRTQGSFTHALGRHVGERITVRLLAQQWRPWPPLGRVLVREVLLCSGSQQWIYALTLIEPAHVKGRNRALGERSTRPLGELLFERGSRRLSLHFGKAASAHRVRQCAQRRAVILPPDAPMRCSWFDYNGSRLLVHECALPALLQWNR